MAAIALVVGLVLLLRSSDGGLVVTVAGAGGQRLDAVEILIDGEVSCKSSPCKLDELSAGTHMVRARADGYQETADTAVLVSGGEDAVHNIKLVRAAGTGVRVSAEGSGLTLFVDGREIGPLPQELKDLTPGEHKIAIRGDQFEPYEQSVMVTENEMQSIGPLRLKVTKGLARIRAGGGADGARIVLEAGDQRKTLPSLPMDLHIETSKPHTLIATRRGYESYRESITFEDGKAEKEFVIELEPQESGDAPTPHRAARPRAPRASQPSTPSAPSGQATLSLNSIPASKVILDGRPLGTTPKVGVSVSPGSHTVMFVRNGKRRTKSVTVAAGEKKLVIHRFE